MKLMLAGSRFMWAAFCLSTVALVCYTAYDRSQGLVAHDWSSGVVASADALRTLLPDISLIAAASWVGRRLDADGYRDLYLSGISISRFLRATAAYIACLVAMVSLGAAAVGVALSGTIWAHRARPLPGGMTPDFVESGLTPRAVLLIAVVLLWVLFGILLGYAVRRASVATGAALAFLFGAILLERAAAVHPLALWVHTLGPLGAGNALVVGQSIPNLPRSGVPTTVAVLTFGAWVLAAGWMVKSRTWTGYLRASGARALRVRVGLGGLVGMTLLLTGFVLPAQLAERIPWQYKAAWRESVESRTSPADTVNGVLSSVLSEDAASVRNQVRPGNGAALRELEIALRASDPDHVVVENVLSANAAGSVVVNLGSAEVTDTGEILPPDQFGFCLVRESGKWVIVQISAQGVTCS